MYHLPFDPASTGCHTWLEIDLPGPYGPGFRLSEKLSVHFGDGASAAPDQGRGVQVICEVSLSIVRPAGRLYGADAWPSGPLPGLAFESQILIRNELFAANVGV